MTNVVRGWTVLCLLAVSHPAWAGSTISVLFVRTADDNGGTASTMTLATATAAISGANAVYKRNGGDVQFKLDPASSFTTVLKSTALNHDCTLPAGATAATIASHTHQVSDTNTLCDTGPELIARTATALECPGKLLVFSRGGSEYVAWDATAGHYDLKYATGGYSGSTLSFVVLGSSFSGNDLAHEMGHYLHLSHTFGTAPATVSAAEADIKSYVGGGQPQSKGLNVFDGDGLSDTPWKKPLRARSTSGSIRRLA